MNMEQFLLRKNKEQLRQAIALHRQEFDENLPTQLRAAQNKLLEWAGEHSSRQGYMPISAELSFKEQDYDTKIGICLFLEAEKYDDIRGFLLTAFEEANVLHDQNIFLQNKNSGLVEKIKELHKEQPELAEKFFPEVCKQPTWDKEWNEEYD